MDLHNGRTSGRSAIFQIDNVERLKMRLHLAKREQSEFSYALSHDLKSPMSTMQMIVEEMEYCLANNEDMDVLIKYLQITISRLSQTFQDVQKYSMVDDDPNDFETINLNHILESILSELSEELESAGAAVSCDLLPMVFASPTQLKLLLNNLIENALKFREPRRPLQIDIRNQSIAGAAQMVTISDNGTGIPRDHWETVFGLFKKVHPDTIQAGSGLGLSICKRVMLNHNGSIRVVSGGSDGTSILLTFGEENEDARLTWHQLG